MVYATSLLYHLSYWWSGQTVLRRASFILEVNSNVLIWGNGSSVLCHVFIKRVFSKGLSILCHFVFEYFALRVNQFLSDGVVSLECTWVLDLEKAQVSQTLLPHTEWKYYSTCSVRFFLKRCHFPQSCFISLALKRSSLGFHRFEVLLNVFVFFAFTSVQVRTYSPWPHYLEMKK